MNSLITRLKHFISLVIIYMFNCLPIKNNKIFFLSYYGTQYGCNPKYITEYILNNFSKDDFDLIWAFNDLKSKEHLSQFRKVKTMSIRYFYELCTSKIIVTNFRTTNLFVKRKNQYYIQTWHSSLRLKQIEKDAADSLPKQYVEMAKMDSLKCDLLLSGCKYSTEIFKRSFWYAGEIFEHGTPRNDFFFQTKSNIRDQILKKLNLPSNEKVILYAPTFRKDNSLEVYNLNYSKISEKLITNFGGNWTFLIRLHPHLESQSGKLLTGENVLNVSSFDDIQELLLVTDILISDYSSLIFDFSFTKRPCFLYVPDFEEYTKHDRKLYFDIGKLPFINVTSNEELMDKIQNFNFEEYERNLIDFLNQIESFEEGDACEKLLNRINQVCFSKKRGQIYEAI